jgi:nicotinamide-nucleotide amidase
MKKLAERLGRLLKKNREALVTAESCTGGWVAQAVTSVAGSSAWFERGFVTYSNDAKRDLLKVSGITLQKHGAVSEQTAREMALGALAQSKGTIALAVTGIAGPGGGSKEKPVGTVCFAWTQGNKVDAETRRFKGGRESVRRQSVVHALEGVMSRLKNGAGRRRKGKQ